MKKIVWMGSSLDDLRSFPDTARRETGHQLHLIQKGLEPFAAKPMSNIGVGVKEIRIHIGNEYRVIYVAKFASAVYVLHCFEKKTRKTPEQAIDLARKRYKQVLAIQEAT